jgi:short-subunit dehydrogenase
MSMQDTATVQESVRREGAARPLAVVTGASTGIGLELARISAMDGHDLVIAADEAEIHEAKAALDQYGGAVHAVEADLSTVEGVERLWSAVQATGKPVSVLFANAGRTLGHAFLEQDFDEIRRVLDTNLLGTVYLLHRFGQDMKLRNEGRILLTGSIAGFMPGPYQAVYNGTKAFINSFSHAMREELKDTQITVTCLMPGATDTEIFERGDMEDTALAHSPKAAPADVAQDGYDAMMRGEGDVVSGWSNKLMTAAASITPAAMLAKAHGKLAKPGSGSD